LKQTDVPIQLPAGQKLGMVSWLAMDAKTGLIWLIQRGNQADPIIAVDASGRVRHSFGKGRFTIPHSIRVGPDGNLWTVDAGSSRIMKFSPTGQELFHFDVGGPNSSDRPFTGATDITFANGRIFISDGYADARILEYTTEGRKVREWGRAGSGPGEFHLPHCIVVDGNGILYVADRENGRIQEFDAEGKFLREIDNLGRTYALQVGPHGRVWAAMAPFNTPPGSPGWIVELNPRTGSILGYIPVADTPALHCLELTRDGGLMTDVGNRVVRFKHHQ
jgi:streptogramin lyase